MTRLSSQRTVIFTMRFRKKAVSVGDLSSLAWLKMNLELAYKYFYILFYLQDFEDDLPISSLDMSLVSLREDVPKLRLNLITHTQKIYVYEPQLCYCCRRWIYPELFIIVCRFIFARLKFAIYIFYFRFEAENMDSYNSWKKAIEIANMKGLSDCKVNCSK